MDYSLLFYMILLSSLMVHLSYRVRKKDIQVNISFWFSVFFLVTSVLNFGFLIFSPEGVSRSLQMIMRVLYGPVLLFVVCVFLSSAMCYIRSYLHFFVFSRLYVFCVRS